MSRDSEVIEMSHLCNDLAIVLRLKYFNRAINRAGRGEQILNAERTETMGVAVDYQ